MAGLFSKSLFSKIQNLAFFSYKLLATLCVYNTDLNLVKIYIHAAAARLVIVWTNIEKREKLEFISFIFYF